MNLYIYFAIIAIFLTLPLVFFRLVYRAYETNAASVVAHLPGDVVERYPDVRIWFKNYDMLKKINKFQTNLTKALYSYNHADLILFPEGLVVIGKSQSYGKLRMISTFAIIWDGRQDRLGMVPNPVKYIGARLTGNDLDIEFHDPEYSNDIKLAVKDVGPGLYVKLSALGLT